MPTAANAATMERPLGVADEAALYLGLMSGTSADGIDVALTSFTPTPKLLAGLTHPYPAALRERILALAQGEGQVALDELGALDVEIGHAFAAATHALLKRENIAANAITALGSHGQTVRHRPNGNYPYTLQLGDPNVIAERTGILTVADFRRRDLAAGGQGAPLLPALHAAVFADAAIPRAILNLGGIANVTLLTPGQDVLGFDTGPANCLLDAWAARHLHAAHDENGAWARSGTIDETLLARWLADPYFAAPPPKSSGREMFNLNWLAARLPPGHAPADVQATLLALSARSIADAVRRQGRGAQQLYACGGGVHNAALMAALRTALPEIYVDTTAALGLDPNYVEAVGFAWLAHARVSHLAGNIPSVTGACGPRVLGAIYSG